MDTSKIKLFWDEETNGLDEQGWVLVDRGTYGARCWYLMAPPEPTLIERLRGFANLRGPYDPLRDDLHKAADELERLGQIEAAVRHARATPPSLCGGRPIQVDREAWGVIEASLAPEEED